MSTSCMVSCLLFAVRWEMMQLTTHAVTNSSRESSYQPSRSHLKDLPVPLSEITILWYAGEIGYFWKKKLNKENLLTMASFLFHQLKEDVFYYFLVGWIPPWLWSVYLKMTKNVRKLSFELDFLNFIIGSLPYLWFKF